ncbi:MAG TPA: GNAT family N-acetyltransferase [Sedimentisphaerales bacterium]|nr:GNAT family N-acetyltransferase [Sedimentisphaerales bacterium]
MIDIRLMTIDDLKLGLRLTEQAGWNQTESDWLRFMNMEPAGCFAAELNGASIGTTATCVLGRVAWIAMVLVDVNARGRGVGTALLKHALNYLDERKVKTVRLDATPAGQPIYEKLGFMPEYKLVRFEGIALSDKKKPVVTKPTPEVFASIIKFDNRMTGTDRAKMLSRLFEEFPENIRVMRHGDIVEGYITTRPGANAVQIGPCIAMKNAGRALLSDALNHCAGKQVFIDIPLDNADAVDIAQSSGLRIQRPFTRMYRGELVKDNVRALWASSGPEKG